MLRALSVVFNARSVMTKAAIFLFSSPVIMFNLIAVSRDSTACKRPVIVRGLCLRIQFIMLNFQLTQPSSSPDQLSGPLWVLVLSAAIALRITSSTPMMSSPVRELLWELPWNFKGSSATMKRDENP